MRHSEPDSVRLIDAIHDHRSVVRYAADELCGLSHQLSALGMMPPLVEALDDIARSLTASSDAVMKAYDADLSGQLRHNSEMTGNLLSLALTVIPERAELAQLRAEKVKEAQSC